MKSIKIRVCPSFSSIKYHLLRGIEQTDALKKAISLSSLSTKAMNRKSEGTSVSISEERMRSERESSRSIQKSKQSLSTTKSAEYKDLPIIKKTSKSPKSSFISHRSSKNINKNQPSRSNNQM